MVSTLKLPASSRCVKYLMFVFNLLFVITGIILLSMGATIHAVYRNYQHFLDDKFLSVPNLLIAVGAIIFFIAFFGCCGAVRENYCMIVTFASLMVLVFILELAGGISGYVLKDHATNIVEKKMLNTMTSYNQTNGTEISAFWDEIQKEFDCCGTNNMTDWHDQLHIDTLPMSCCTPQAGVLGEAKCNANSTNVHENGCLPQVLTFVKAHAVQLGGAGIGIAFVQAVGVWFSIYLARSIKNSYETV